MSRKNKEVVIEKDGVEAVATEITLKGLLKHGWTLKDDGDKEAEKAAEAHAKEQEELNKKIEQLFPTDEEN